MRTNHFLRTWLWITILALWSPHFVMAQSQTRPADPAAWNERLELGPLAGWTSIWHSAPVETAVPVGADLTFRVRVPRPLRVEWTGAREIERGRAGSLAQVVLDTPGLHRVTVGYEDRKRGWVEEGITLEAVALSATGIELRPISVFAEPMELDEENTNASTMRYFFSPNSIADLTHVGSDHYRTSVNRWLTYEVEVHPRSFAPLVEWRLNGEPQRHLGSTIHMAVYPARAHTVSAGPLDVEQAVQLDTYRVKILEPADEIRDGVPMTLEAVTVPPGHEDEITWLASTKYGSCQPLTGQGPSFTVRFDNTSGSEGRWLGVRADNGTVSEDTKDPGPGIDIVPQLDLTTTVDPRCEEDVTHQLSVNWMVQDAEDPADVLVRVILADGTVLEAEGGEIGQAEFGLTAPAGGVAQVVVGSDLVLGVCQVPSPESVSANDPPESPFTLSNDTLVALDPCEPPEIPDPGVGFDPDDPTLAVPGSGVLREVDLAFLGPSPRPDPEGLLPDPVFVTAVSSGEAVQLSSWQLVGSTPTPLADAEPVLGFDVRLLALTEGDRPPLDDSVPFVAAVRQEDGNLSLSTYSVGSSGEIVHHDTLEYDGSGVGAEVLGHAIAHRPIFSALFGVTHLVVTPILTEAGNLRLLVWSINDALEITGEQDSGDWAPPLPAADTKLAIARFDETTFVINYRTVGGILSSRFWDVGTTADGFSQLLQESGASTSGSPISNRASAAVVQYEIDDAAVSPLPQAGFVTAFLGEEPSSPRMAVWEPRLANPDDLGNLDRQLYRLTDDRLDGDLGFGVEVGPSPILSDIGDEDAPVRGILTDALWERTGQGAGRIVDVRAEGVRSGIASITKIMTLFVTLEKVLDGTGTVNLDDEVHISATAVSINGSLMGLVDNETWKLEDLLYGMMMVSGNDAALAIAEHVSEKTGEIFVDQNLGTDDLMNRTAARLAMERTLYGQAARGGISTPQDQATLLLASLTNESGQFVSLFKEFTTRKQLEVCGQTAQGDERCLDLKNKSIVDYPGEGSTKDGSVGTRVRDAGTDLGSPPLCRPGLCLISEATRLSRRFVSEVQNSRDFLGDVKCLFDYGFSNLFTPDLRAASGNTGGMATELSLAMVSEDLVLTAAINGVGALDVCPWAVDAEAGQLQKLPNCQLRTITDLAEGPDRVRPPKVELVRLPTDLAAGNYVRGFLEDDLLKLDVWKIGPTEP